MEFQVIAVHKATDEDRARRKMPGLIATGKVQLRPADAERLSLVREYKSGDDWKEVEVAGVTGGTVEVWGDWAVSKAGDSEYFRSPAKLQRDVKERILDAMSQALQEQEKARTQRAGLRPTTAPVEPAKEPAKAGTNGTGRPRTV